MHYERNNQYKYTNTSIAHVDKYLIKSRRAQTQFWYSWHHLSYMMWSGDSQIGSGVGATGFLVRRHGTHGQHPERQGLFCGRHPGPLISLIEGHQGPEVARRRPARAPALAICKRRRPIDPSVATVPWPLCRYFFSPYFHSWLPIMPSRNKGVIAIKQQVTSTFVFGAHSAANVTGKQVLLWFKSLLCFNKLIGTLFRNKIIILACNF